MKKQKNIYLQLLSVVLSLGVLLASCDNDKEDLFLESSAVNNEFKVDGNTFLSTIQVKSSSEWSLQSDLADSWLTIEKSDDVVTIKLTPNTTERERKESFKILNTQGLELNITIIQEKGIDSDIQLEYNGDVWLNYHDTELTFNIKSSQKWTSSIEGGEWLSTNTAQIENVENENATITLKFDKNNDKEKREARFTIMSGKETKRINVIQRGMKGHEDITHYFYMHWATFPVLYSALNLVQHDKPAYFIDWRKTVNVDKLGANVTVMNMLEFPGNFINKIKEINESNPDAVFGYITEDLRGAFSLPIFTQLEIDSSRVKIKMHPDGVGTYLSVFNTNYGENGTGGTKYKDKLKEFDEYYKSLIENPKKGEQITNRNQTDNKEYPHIFAHKSQVEYYIQDRSYLITEDPYVQEQINSVNYVVKTPIEILNSLTKEQQSKFYELVEFNPDVYRKQFETSPKPNLIILGTHTMPTGTTATQQAKYVQEVMDTYGSDYDIFYKAHPSDKAYQDYETRFPGLKLIMPAKMPFEVFTWALDNQLDIIGGFTSTAMLSMPLNKIKFIFAKDAEDMNVLFKKVLSDRNDIHWVNIN